MVIVVMITYVVLCTYLNPTINILKYISSTTDNQVISQEVSNSLLTC